MRTLFFSSWSAPWEQHSHQEVTERYQVSIITQCLTSLDNSKHISHVIFVLFLSPSVALSTIRQLASQSRNIQSIIYFCAIFHADQAKQLSSWISVKGMLINPLSNFYITEKRPHLKPMVLSDSKFTINIHIKIKKMENIINYHKSTLYIPVKCTMQQSVNGNIQHKICDNKREGDFAGNKASTAVSTAVFLVCFSCTVCVGLGSSCCEFKKCSSASIGLWQGGSFQCEFVAANCLSDRFFKKGGEVPLAQWFSSEILKQVINFHAENTPG